MSTDELRQRLESAKARVGEIQADVDDSNQAAEYGAPLAALVREELAWAASLMGDPACEGLARAILDRVERHLMPGDGEGPTK